MRLLNVNDFEVVTFLHRPRPAYIVASHRWFRDDRNRDAEPSLEDVEKKIHKTKTGWRKVEELCSYIKKRYPIIEWLWYDTCCIDHRNSKEVESAVLSMYHWYQEAYCCLAYLTDVSSASDFEQSIWFTRGWTLQELLAPRYVIVLNKYQAPLGYKGPRYRNGAALLPTAVPAINQVTRIPEVVLYNDDKDHKWSTGLNPHDVFQWMDKRTTSFIEDQAYCLLGLFGLSMNIRYGDAEGDNALKRLQKKLEKAGSYNARRVEHSASSDKQYWLLPRADLSAMMIIGKASTDSTIQLSSSAETGRARQFVPLRSLTSTPGCASTVARSVPALQLTQHRAPLITASQTSRSPKPSWAAFTNSTSLPAATAPSFVSPHNMALTSSRARSNFQNLLPSQTTRISTIVVPGNVPKAFVAKDLVWRGRSAVGAEELANVERGASALDDIVQSKGEASIASEIQSRSSTPESPEQGGVWIGQPPISPKGRLRRQSRIPSDSRRLPSAPDSWDSDSDDSLSVPLDSMSIHVMTQGRGVDRLTLRAQHQDARSEAKDAILKVMFRALLKITIGGEASAQIVSDVMSECLNELLEFADSKVHGLVRAGRKGISPFGEPSLQHYAEACARFQAMYMKDTAYRSGLREQAQNVRAALRDRFLTCWMVEDDGSGPRIVMADSTATAAAYNSQIERTIADSASTRRSSESSLDDTAAISDTQVSDNMPPRVAYELAPSAEPSIIQNKRRPGFVAGNGLAAELMLDEVDTPHLFRQAMIYAAASAETVPATNITTFPYQLKPKKFFRCGRVFALPTSEGILKLIAVPTKKEPNTCYALQIKTYHGQGVAAAGVVRRNHGVVYSGEAVHVLPQERLCQPNETIEEGMQSKAVKIMPTLSGQGLDPVSRIDYSKLVRIPVPATVYEIGQAGGNNQWALLDQFVRVQGKLLQAQITANNGNTAGMDFLL